MTGENQYLKNIKKGMKVEIWTNQNKFVRGIVDDIASRTEHHSKGIMVRLESGEIGRVQKILLNGEEINKRDEFEIRKMIEKGESFFVEFKSNCLWSINYNDQDIKQSKSFDVHQFKQKASKVIIAKSIASFFNSGGGSLVIGIMEDKQNSKYVINGINQDLEKLKNIGKDFSIDGYKRMILDDVIRSYFPPKIYNHLNEYLWINFVELAVNDTEQKCPVSPNPLQNKSEGFGENEKKVVCWIKIKKCDVKVFLKVNDKEIFMIRTDTENRALDGERLVDYCMRRFR